jgi:O-methyltransferase
MLATIQRDGSATIRKCSRREEMYSAVNEALGKVAISYLEFGVWKGESLEKWTAINTDAQSRFYGFDSFEGLPEPWNHSFGKAIGTDTFDVGGMLPTMKDARVRFVKGWFQHTVRDFLRHTELPHPIVVHVDSDLYSSALYVLCTLDSILERGDVIMFDEYNSPSHEYLAWEEYKRVFMRNAECIAMSDRWTQAAFVMT